MDPSTQPPISTVLTLSRVAIKGSLGSHQDPVISVTRSRSRMPTGPVRAVPGQPMPKSPAHILPLTKPEGWSPYFENQPLTCTYLVAGAGFEPATSGL
jgi:hypothetical protein